MQNSKKPLKFLNIAVFLQQQRYLLPVSFLFYLYNGLNLADFIFFQGIFYFICLAAEIPAGYLGDIFKRKNVLIFSYFLFLGRILLWIFFRGYWVVLAGEILYALSKACYRGTSDGYIYDYLKEKNTTDKMLDKFGRYNFFMSLGCALSGVIGAIFFKYCGVKILLLSEFIIHTSAIMILFFLPQIPHSTVRSTNFKNHIKTIFNAIKNILSNSNINKQIFYCGILTGITSLFVWNFQPAMKLSAVPVIFFGIIYFINHILRATASLNAQKIIDKINFKALGLVVWVFYLLSFAIILFNRFYINPYICLFSLLFICFAIGLYMAYSVTTTSLIHKFANNETRATMSSVNYMIAGFCSSLFLMIYKNLIDYLSISRAFLIFALLFVFAIVLPYQIFKK